MLRRTRKALSTLILSADRTLITAHPLQPLGARIRTCRQIPVAQREQEPRLEDGHTTRETNISSREIQLFQRLALESLSRRVELRAQKIIGECASAPIPIARVSAERVGHLQDGRGRSLTHNRRFLQASRVDSITPCSFCRLGIWSSTISTPRIRRFQTLGSSPLHRRFKLGVPAVVE